MFVFESNIPQDTKISSINTTDNKITLDKAMTGNIATTDSISFSGVDVVPAETTVQYVDRENCNIVLTKDLDDEISSTDLIYFYLSVTSRPFNIYDSQLDSGAIELRVPREIDRTLQENEGTCLPLCTPVKVFNNGRVSFLLP